jgi:hypothetical protein
MLGLREWPDVGDIAGMKKAGATKDALLMTTET